MPSKKKSVTAEKKIIARKGLKREKKKASPKRNQNSSTPVIGLGGLPFDDLTHEGLVEVQGECPMAFSIINQLPEKQNGELVIFLLMFLSRDAFAYDGEAWFYRGENSASRKIYILISFFKIWKEAFKVEENQKARFLARYEIVRKLIGNEEFHCLNLKESPDRLLYQIYEERGLSDFHLEAPGFHELSVLVGSEIRFSAIYEMMLSYSVRSARLKNHNSELARAAYLLDRIKTWSDAEALDDSTALAYMDASFNELGNLVALSCFNSDRDFFKGLLNIVSARGSLEPPAIHEIDGRCIVAAAFLGYEDKIGSAPKKHQLDLFIRENFNYHIPTERVVHYIKVLGLPVNREAGRPRKNRGVTATF